MPLNEATAIALVESALALELSRHPRVMLVHYEKLVRSPEQSLESIVQFLGTSQPGVERMPGYEEHTGRLTGYDVTLQKGVWHSLPIANVSTRSVGVYKQELSAAQLSYLGCFRISDSMMVSRELHGTSFRHVVQSLGYASGPDEAVSEWRLARLHVEQGSFEAPSSASVYQLPYGPWQRTVIELVVDEQPPAFLSSALVSLDEKAGQVRAALQEGHAATYQQLANLVVQLDELREEMRQRAWTHKTLLIVVGVQLWVLFLLLVVNRIGR